MRKSLLTAAVVAAIAPSASAHTPGAHWCRQGDPPLRASAATTCRDAAKIIDAYVNICHEARHCRIQLTLAEPRVRYWITCRRTGSHRNGFVYCHGPARTHMWTRFSAVI